MTAALKIYGGRRRRHCKALLRGLPRGSQVWVATTRSPTHLLLRGPPDVRGSHCVAPAYNPQNGTHVVPPAWLLPYGSSRMVPPARLPAHSSLTSPCGLHVNIAYATTKRSNMLSSPLSLHPGSCQAMAIFAKRKKSYFEICVSIVVMQCVTMSSTL